MWNQKNERWGRGKKSDREAERKLLCHNFENKTNIKYNFKFKT